MNFLLVLKLLGHNELANLPRSQVLLVHMIILKSTIQLAIYQLKCCQKRVTLTPIQRKSWYNLILKINSPFFGGGNESLVVIAGALPFIYSQGNEFFKQKKFKEAIDCYSRSIALSPTAVAYANRAMAYLKIKR